MKIMFTIEKKRKRRSFKSIGIFEKPKFMALLSKIQFSIISKTAPLSKRDIVLFSSQLGLLENHTSHFPLTTIK